MAEQAARRRVILLFGGRSAEHEVSCTSAVSVLRALDPERYDITPIGITQEGGWVLSDSAMALLAGTDRSMIRVEAAGAPVDQGVVLALPAPPIEHRSEALPVVIPILHGPFGEDGTMQGLLELAGLPYVGAGVLGSAVAMDKGVAKDLLKAAGLPQAGWLVRAGWEVPDVAARVSFATEVASTLGWPVFVKPANLGSSVGVSRADDAESFSGALELALGFDDWIVVEEAIVGREIEFAVLGNENPEVSLPGEIVPGHDFYDYEDKYLEDHAQLVIPAPLSHGDVAEGQRLALAAYRALRCEGMARVDFFFDDGSTGGPGRGWIVNEANTIPGFTPVSMYPKLWAASGLSYPHLVDRLIDLAAARHARRAGRVGRGRQP